ncbi:hypothetical protein M900_2785 [Bacteriovorax sp. Seq25_V]|nr:hypothetical protein M900_2785 [Bacteriovorax sp. Seq25_V]
MDVKSLDNKTNSYVITDGYSLYGEVSYEELFTGYSVLKVKDENGTLHIIDPEVTSTKVYPSGKEHQGNRYYSRKPDLPKLQKDKFLAGYCSSIKAVNQESLAKYKKLFSKYTIKETPIKSRGKAAAMCFGGMGTIPATGLIAYSTIYKDREYKRDQSWYEMHGSNWILGLGFMAAFHQCSNILAPAKYQAFLALTLGVDVAANIMYEVKFSDTFIPPIEEKPVTTDPNDLVAGLVGAANYYLVAQIFKDMFGVSQEKFCKSYLQKL